MVAREIRHLYWFIRTLRRGLQDAPRRRYYRKIAGQKKRLLDAGVSKREVLDLLACCRSARCRFRACLDCSQPLFCVILLLTH
ncbi:conserved hypothetical protein [Cupriavidus taiwanensis]|uniref:Uncharacterized protein n=1 Tax=Cupriavidus taiwanensis TaxID=164546 RepID=A0A976AAW6_9BURK|nr:conserved hypothetical protein [Cupriavidus taiwanensis]